MLTVIDYLSEDIFANFINVERIVPPESVKTLAKQVFKNDVKLQIPADS